MLCHGLTLAAITAALGNSPEAQPDPEKRYGAGVTTGIIKIVLDLFGATIVAFLQACPNLLLQPWQVWHSRAPFKPVWCAALVIAKTATLPSLPCSWPLQMYSFWHRQCFLETGGWIYRK